MSGRPIMHGASVVRSQLGLIALTKRKGDIYGRVHVFPHTLRSIFGRAANPEFLLRFSYVVVRASVRYASLYRLLLRTSGLGCVPIIPDTWLSLISYWFRGGFSRRPREIFRTVRRTENRTPRCDVRYANQLGISMLLSRFFSSKCEISLVSIWRVCLTKVKMTLNQRKSWK